MRAAPKRPSGVVMTGYKLLLSDLVLQVGLVSQADGGTFRILADEEVEEHLTAISERD